MKATNKIQQRKDIGFIASIISLSMFDEIRDHVNNGTIAAHEKISELAVTIERLHRGVDMESWEDTYEEEGVCDYEDLVLGMVREMLKL